MASHPQHIGDYEVVKELGRGAMGVVYLAVHPTLGREMAIKVMARELASDPEFLERFRREGKMAARLRHPNIVQVFDFAQRDGLYFIVMEYLGARTLKDLLQESGQQPVEKACDLIGQLLSALSAAHFKGIVHRDIKPANVMLTDEGAVALTDFSVAHMKESSKLTQTGAVMGTPEYMAPEQFEGNWDHRSDIYSAGILLYELLTGLSPFRSATLTEVMRKQLLTVPDPPSAVDFTLPEAVSLVVARMLEKDPESRYQSAEETRQALAASLRNTGSSPPPVAAALAPVEGENSTAELEQRPALPLPIGTSRPIETPKQAQAPKPDASKANLRVLAALTAAILCWKGLTWERTAPATPEISSPAPIAEASTERTRVATETSSPSELSYGDASTPDELTYPTSIPIEDNPAPRESPELQATPRPSSTAFPTLANVQAGFAVGEVQLGLGKEQVEALWGQPNLVDANVDGREVWSYGADPILCTLRFVIETGALESITVFAPTFFIEGQAELGVGGGYQAILEANGPPTTQTDTRLDYNDKGVCFEFAADKSRGDICESVTIYQAGLTQWGGEK